MSDVNSTGPLIVVGRVPREGLSDGEDAMRLHLIEQLRARAASAFFEVARVHDGPVLIRRIAEGTNPLPPHPDPGPRQARECEEYRIAVFCVAMNPRERNASTVMSTGNRDLDLISAGIVEYVEYVETEPPPPPLPPGQTGEEPGLPRLWEQKAQERSE